MATATKVGAMIRRGAANVSPETRILVDNPDKVKAIVDAKSTAVRTSFKSCSNRRGLGGRT